MECRMHGEAEFLIEGRGYYRCKQCRVGTPSAGGDGG